MIRATDVLSILLQTEVPQRGGLSKMAAVKSSIQPFFRWVVPVNKVSDL